MCGFLIIDTLATKGLAYPLFLFLFLYLSKSNHNKIFKFGYKYTRYMLPERLQFLWFGYISHTLGLEAWHKQA